MSKIKNIDINHFQSFQLPSIQCKEVINTFVFYRKDNFVLDTKKEEKNNKIRFENKFLKYLDENIDFKTLIFKLFEFSKNTDDNFLFPIQKRIKSFNFSKIPKNVQQKIKWLLYDCKNSSGNPLCNNIPSEFISNNKELYVFFTDNCIQNYLKGKAYKNGIYNFYTNESKKLKYFKITEKLNYSNTTICSNQIKKNPQFCPIHKLVLSRGNSNYKIDDDKYIDHIQKAPEYYFDFNFQSNIINAIINNKDNETKMITEMIYSKILECWNKYLLNYNNTPQINNCNYNLKCLDKNFNMGIKANIIDRSSIIYPRKDLIDKDVFYIFFYFPKTQNIKINNTNENIVALTIIYDFELISYEEIIEELSNNIFDDNNNSNNYDDRIDYDKLFNYIKGKNILIMKENKESTLQQGILNLKDSFDENTENVIKIQNYN